MAEEVENFHLRGCPWSQFVKYIVGGFCDEKRFLRSNGGVQCVIDVLEVVHHDEVCIVTDLLFLLVSFFGNSITAEVDYRYGKLLRRRVKKVYLISSHKQ